MRLKCRYDYEAHSHRTVHFVHFSVKEYLSSLNDTNPSYAQALELFDDNVEHDRLSKVCLHYLCFDVFDEIPEDTKKFPFLSYAAWAWNIHGFHQKPIPSADILCHAQKVFDPFNSSWKVWSPVLEAKLFDSDEENWDKEIESYRQSEYGDQTEGGHDMLSTRSPTETSLTSKSTISIPASVQNPMYYAFFLGLNDVIMWLEKQGLDCMSLGGRFGFPLQAAVVRRHEVTVTYLLDHQVDVS